MRLVFYTKGQEKFGRAFTVVTIKCSCMNKVSPSKTESRTSLSVDAVIMGCKSVEDRATVLNLDVYA